MFANVQVMGYVTAVSLEMDLVSAARGGTVSRALCLALEGPRLLAQTTEPALLKLASVLAPRAMPLKTALSPAVTVELMDTAMRGEQERVFAFAMLAGSFQTQNATHGVIVVPMDGAIANEYVCALLSGMGRPAIDVHQGTLEPIAPSHANLDPLLRELVSVMKMLVVKNVMFRVRSILTIPAPIKVFATMVKGALERVCASRVTLAQLANAVSMNVNLPE